MEEAWLCSALTLRVVTSNLYLLCGIQRHMVTEKKEARPVAMNAFELISLSQGLNLSGLFESKEVLLTLSCTCGL